MKKLYNIGMPLLLAGCVAISTPTAYAPTNIPIPQAQYQSNPLPRQVSQIIPQGQIAYTVGSSIEVVNDDGTNRKILVEDEITDFAWSPDGRKIAYVSNRVLDVSGFYKPGIILLDLVSGERETIVTPEPVPDSSEYYYDYLYLRWSPDGKWLYYEALSPDIEDIIRKVEVEQEGYTTIFRNWPFGTDFQGFDVSPIMVLDGFDVSPISGEVVYALNLVKEGDLLRGSLFVLPDGVDTEKTDILQTYVPYYSNTMYEISLPRWSPDGEKIAFFASRRFQSGGEGIFIVEKGNVSRRLTTGIDYVSSWSPDGEWITFTREGEGGIWIVHVTHGYLINLTSFLGVGGFHPEWRP